MKTTFDNPSDPDMVFSSSAFRNVIFGKRYKVRHPDKWKGAGIAVPVFSLRTKDSFGTGEFLDLKLLIDWAVKSGFQLIQILPVNDTSANLNWMDSFPYSAICVFALHPFYLGLQAIGNLPDNITKEISSQKKFLNRYDYVDYDKVMKFKRRLIHKIFKIKKDKFLSSRAFQRFLKENSFWLKPYAAFCMLRDKNRTSDYTKWGRYACVSGKDMDALTSPDSPDFDTIAENYFIQYHLHMQLLEASLYGKSKHVVLKGDVPIGIYKYSVSCWTNPEIFNLNQSAGAPPDPFSDIGQNWQFPTYNWDEMGKDNYSWWRKRLKHMSDYFQMIRLDHVLGFFRIWEIPNYSTSGIMGHFNPAVPISKEELEKQGICDFNRLCEPYIHHWLVKNLFGKDTDTALSKFFENADNGFFRLKTEFRTQRQVEKLDDKIKNGLSYLISNIVLFKDPSNNGFHPRINMMNTPSFACLDKSIQDKLKNLYYDYFYHRQDELWTRQAMIRLPVLKESSNMLVCGEDLGMIPDCVPPVMEKLGILGLRIQRMPKETDREFGDPNTYPYLTVCTTSSHDMSTIRGWWEEDKEKTQRYYNSVLKHSGNAPKTCTPEICKEIIIQHLESPSMWAIFPIQDILGMSAELRHKGDPGDEQINVPADPHHFWKFRLHISLEELMKHRDFCSELKKMIKKTSRL